MIRSARILRLVAAAACGLPIACSTSTAPKLVDHDSPRFTCVSDAPGIDLPANLRAQLPPASPFWEDDQWTHIARTEPGGFAGIYENSDTTWVAEFVGPLSAADATSILDLLGVPVAVRGRVSYSKVKWNYAQISDWFAYLGSGLGAGGGYVRDGYLNSITASFIDEDARARAISILNSAGIPCNLVRTVIGALPTPDIAR